MVLKIFVLNKLIKRRQKQDDNAAKAKHRKLELNRAIDKVIVTTSSLPDLISSFSLRPSKKCVGRPFWSYMQLPARSVFFNTAATRRVKSWDPSAVAEMTRNIEL
jgi:hypothetical protein